MARISIPDILRDERATVLVAYRLAALARDMMREPNGTPLTFEQEMTNGEAQTYLEYANGLREMHGLDYLVASAPVAPDHTTNDRFVNREYSDQN